MKKKFINPEIKVNVFFTENILTASGGNTGGETQATLKDDMTKGGVKSIAETSYVSLTEAFTK